MIFCLKKTEKIYKKVSLIDNSYLKPFKYIIKLLLFFIIKKLKNFLALQRVSAIFWF